MKFVLLLLFQFPLLPGLHAQKKLKMDIIKDTGDTLWSTSDQKIYVKAGSPRSVGEYLKTSVMKSKAGYSLELEIQTGRTNVFTIGKGAAVDIELSDGSTVSLYTSSNNSSRVSRLDYGCYIFAFYRIPPAEFKQLLASPVSLIRVHASIGDMDYEIREKFENALQGQLKRITQ